MDGAGLGVALLAAGREPLCCCCCCCGGGRGRGEASEPRSRIPPRAVPRGVALLATRAPCSQDCRFPRGDSFRGGPILSSGGVLACTPSSPPASALALLPPSSRPLPASAAPRPAAPTSPVRGSACARPPGAPPADRARDGGEGARAPSGAPPSICASRACRASTRTRTAVEPPAPTPGAPGRSCAAFSHPCRPPPRRAPQARCAARRGGAGGGAGAGAPAPERCSLPRGRPLPGMRGETCPVSTGEGRDVSN